MLIILKCHTLSATDGGIGHPPFQIRSKTCGGNVDSVECSFIASQCFYHEICVILLSVGQLKENGKWYRAAFFFFKQIWNPEVLLKGTRSFPRSLVQNIFDNSLWLMTGSKEITDRFFTRLPFSSSGKSCFCIVLAFIFN